MYNGLVATVEVEAEVVEHRPVVGGGIGASDAETQTFARCGDFGGYAAVIESFVEITFSTCHTVGDVGSVTHLSVAAPTTVVEEGGGLSVVADVTDG